MLVVDSHIQIYYNRTHCDKNAARQRKLIFSGTNFSVRLFLLFVLVIHSLCRLLEKSHIYGRFLHWLPNGEAFIILDTLAFELVVLPQHFHHTKINSFLRQLSLFGFNRKKISRSHAEDILQGRATCLLPNMDALQSSSIDSAPILVTLKPANTFSFLVQHRYMVRGYPELLILIDKKKVIRSIAGNETQSRDKSRCSTSDESSSSDSCGSFRRSGKRKHTELEVSELSQAQEDRIRNLEIQQSQMWNQLRHIADVLDCKLSRDMETLKAIEARREHVLFSFMDLVVKGPKSSLHHANGLKPAVPFNNQNLFNPTLAPALAEMENFQNFLSGS